MISIAVLAGGTSDERAVSLRSGSAVATALRAGGYDVEILDPQGDVGDILQQLQKYDVVFPVLHGKGGEDGIIQKLFEDNNIRYVGSDSTSSTLCSDKWAYKQKLTEAGIIAPNGALVDKETVWSHDLIKNPFVLKPYNGGSSIDTFIVRDINQIDTKQINEALDRHGEMLLEELIAGTEITVGVLGEDALPVIEIIPPESGEFDYENKYNGATQELCPPQNVPADIQAQAQQIAVAVHTLTGCRDMSRTDFMIDSGGKLYVLETNTIPGMTDQSLFPKAAATAGIPMQATVDRLVRLALSRSAETAAA